MIRGFFLTLLNILLFLSLLTMITSWDLSSSLKYENVQNGMVNLSPLIGSQFNLSQQAYNNPDLIKNFTSDLYYKNYNCSYWNCLNQYYIPFLISEQSENYWNNLVYISLAISILITIIIFFLIEKKQNLFFPVGILIIIASLPLLLINQILSHLSNVEISLLVSILLSQFHYVFIRMIIIGIIILLIGIIIKLSQAGSKIYEKFSKLKNSNTSIKKINIKKNKK